MKLHGLSIFKRVLVAMWLLLVATLAVTLPVAADPLGEHILAGIQRGEKYSKASLLLLTQDLKWYEQNMQRLEGPIQDQIQRLRIDLAGQVAESSARQLGEAEAAFAATGSWKPGRDMDIVYMGKKGNAAAEAIARNYEGHSVSFLASADADPILKSYSGAIPRQLTTQSLAVCTTELPNFGYDDLNKAYIQAKRALARGESKDEILATMRRDIQQAMSNNMNAHFAAQANPDYYAGATGQDWFRKTYLDNPDRMRTFMQNESGNWVLKPGGIQAVPAEIVERLGFGSMGGSGVKFSKIASDYALFFSHMHGGPSDNAKYVLRVWKDMGLNAIQDLSDADIKMLAAAKAASAKPSQAAQILAEAGLSADDFNKNMSRILLNWTESQLVKDMDMLVTELGSSSAKTVDELDKLLRQAKTTMNLNELVAGLEKLKAAPKEVQAQLIERLKTKFGSSPAGVAAINFVMRNLGLLGDSSGELTRRLVIILKDMGKIQQQDADALLRGEPASDAAQAQMKRARQEIAALSSGGMVEFDDALDVDRLMEDWRKAKPDALLQSPSDELKKTLEELRGSVDEARLKELGWADDEIAAHRRVLDRMRKDAMRKLGQKLEPRLVKGGVSLRNFQQKVRELIFSPAYTKLGDASSSVGVFDAVVGVAAGLYSTYDILNNQRLSPADEAQALENAWVTAIPIVGDFAQGLITGGQAFYEGDKGKALEAGLWITIGTMGCVPGGQLPAVILGIGLATKPIVAGSYDARQAQHLVQAWIESGKWSKDKPRKLLGLYDRASGDPEIYLDIKYSELLTDKAKLPYKSTRLGDVSINQSIRDYAEKYVTPQYPAIKSIREALLSVYPDFNDKEWSDEFSASLKIDARGGKGSKILFRSYFQLHGKAMVQTINHLKQWAEDEMRALKDYDSEAARLRDELRTLERALQTGNLVSNADASVEAYSKIVANLWEQESLPLARLRIYEHYVKTYRTIEGKLRRVMDILKEASNPFLPPGWHLTGYPELDRDRVDKLSASMENGRKGVIDDIENTLKEFGIRSTRYDKNNACHKAAFDALAPLRYKYAFIEFQALYFKALAEGSSTWSSAYETAKARYQESRAQVLRNIGSNLQAHPHVMMLMEQKAMTDAFMSFVVAVPYALASTEVGVYQSAARDYELRQYSAGLDYQLAKGRSGKVGRDLADCLQAQLQIDLQLSSPQPEAGTDVTASYRLVKGETHADVVWDWKLEGALVKKSATAGSLVMTVNGPGKLTVYLRDWYNPNTGKYGKVLAEASVDIQPGLPSDVKVFVSGPAQAELGSNVSYFASIDAKPGVAQAMLANAHIEWRLNGDAGAGSDSSFRFSPIRAGSYSVVATAYVMDHGKKRVIASSRPITLQVRDGTDKDGAANPDNGKRDGELDKTKEAPSCSYTYSEWGECSRATKKQTRSVTATKPAACVEKAKPLLEQGCTPPPSEEDKKNSYLNCLCRCSSGWAGHIGVWYDPEQKTVPECKSSGPCIGGIGAFGCSSRHFFNSSSECAKGCWEGAYGKDSFDTDKASKMAKEENKKYKKPPTVKISASKNPADFGDIVTLTGQASEGSGGFKWNWGGCAQDAKDNTAKVVNSRSCQACQASVTVTDSDGDSASDNLTIQCTALKVKLTKESPKDNRLPVGSSAKFFAEVMSGTQAASGSFSYIWERNPDAVFGDPKNPAYETKGGAQSRNTASFGKLGTIPIWVSVLKEVDGRKMTIGESDQIMMEVVKPRLTLSAEPKDAMVGQEIKITVQEEPKMSDDLLSFWWEISGEANNPGPVPNVPNSRAYSFKPKSDKPVTVTVHAKAKDGGDELGVEKITLQAKKPSITVAGPKIAGPAPMIWKEGVGLVSVGQQVVEDQRVEFAVTVSPELKQELRYQWSVKPEGCSLSAPSSKETGITCAKTGGYALTVVVRNSEGAELGSGEGSLNVTVSQSDIKKGKQKDEAAKKLEQARALWSQGKIDEALALLATVASTEPQLAAPVINQFGQGLKKLGSDALQALDPTTAVKRLEQAVKLLPGDAEIRQKLQQAQQMVQLQAQALQFLEAAKANLARGVPADLKGLTELLAELKKREAAFAPADPRRPPFAAFAASTQQKLAQAQQQAAACEVKWTEGKALYDAKKMPEALAKFKENLVCAPGRPERQAYVGQLEQAIKAQQAQQAAAKRLRDEGAALQAQNKLPEALAKYRESLKLLPDPALAQHLQTLERQLQEAQQKAARAQQLRAEGEALQRQNHIPEAIAKYRESLKLVPDAKLEQHVQTLEQQAQQQQQNMAHAQKLRAEGEALQRQNRIPEAIAKYRQSLSLVPDRALEQHIQTLEQQTQQQQQNMAQAQRLRAEGEALQRQNRIPEAISKYRQSLSLVPDRALEQHIQTLERILQTPAPVPPVPIAPVQPVPSQPVPSLPGGRSYTAIEPGQSKADYCRNYTNLAITRQNENVRRGCRYTGNRWHTSDSGHYNWCLGVSLEMSASETHGRETDLQSCQQSPPANPQGKSRVLFENGNVSGVYNLPTRPTTFSLSQPATIVSIVNYHWNDGRGKTSTGTISLRDAAGHVLGPWLTTGTPGQGGVPNAYWTARPSIQLPAGSYTVIDSDPSTWAQNSGSNGAGHTRIEGY